MSQIDLYSGSIDNGRMRGSQGVAHVMQTTAGIALSKNRYLSACATTDVTATNTCTWDSPGITELTVLVPTTASLTSVMAVFDAPSDLVAATWLTAGVTTSTDADLLVVRVLPALERTFYFSAPITRVDFRAVGAACPVFVEAA